MAIYKRWGAVVKVLIQDIIIKNRIRIDTGDISDLMESISKYGLLNPITVTKDFELIAGFRRLEACKALGMTEIECNVVNIQSKIDKLLIEADENLTRKDLTVLEIERYEDEKRYMMSNGLQRIRLWIIRLFKRILSWIRRNILKRAY
jgi:ParB family transcriptional regulator, chromosome partitioning protein